MGHGVSVKSFRTIQKYESQSWCFTIVVGQHILKNSFRLAVRKLTYKIKAIVFKVIVYNFLWEFLNYIGGNFLNCFLT
jgi:hypothetical protein